MVVVSSWTECEWLSKWIIYKWILSHRKFVWNNKQLLFTAEVDWIYHCLPVACFHCFTGFKLIVTKFLAKNESTILIYLQATTIHMNPLEAMWTQCKKSFKKVSLLQLGIFDCTDVFWKIFTKSVLEKIELLKILY